MVRLRLHPVVHTVKGFAFISVTAVLLYFTIRKLVDTARKASRERDETAGLYRTVVEASGEGICLFDTSGRISFLNRRLAAMLGSPAEQLKGQRIQDLVEEPELLPADSAKAKLPGTQECRLRTASGYKPWVLISCTPLVRPEGTFDGHLAMFLDVTERRNLEEELRHAQKLKAVGSFVSGITHDFNNLLSIVTGYGSLLEKALPPAGEAGNAAREILGACERGSLLIRQMLAFSRKQPAIAELVNVRENVSRLAELLPRLAGENIRVAVKCEEATGFVRIGAGQIEQILMNLAANARDAMPRGGAITIATRKTEVTEAAAWAHGVAPGPYVAIRVSDTGTGIDPDLKTHIFEPFFTTKPQGAGTGLGLSTVYGIAAQNGGFITCESALGNGTTFTVYLPFTGKPPLPDTQLPAEPPRAIAGTESVLLVEDDSALRALTKHILSSHGYAVQDAAHATQALQLIESGARPDLLLTDVVMPGMSGVELADRIARSFPATLIVYMSGHAEVSDRLDGKAHIIQKPVAPDALLLQLRAILGAHAAKGHCAA
jgi:PAS domain S-box-containing protein